MDDLKLLENSRLFAGIRVGEIQPMLSCLQAVERKYPRGARISSTRARRCARLRCSCAARRTSRRRTSGATGRCWHHWRRAIFLPRRMQCPAPARCAATWWLWRACTVLLMDVERVLSRCTNSCAFHARLTENLFALLAEKNRILARKVDYLAQRTTRQRLLVYLSEQAQRRQCGFTSRSTGSSWPIFSRSNGARCPPSFRGCRRRA